MQWIAPSENDPNPAALDPRLWDAADPFRANSGLKSQEYSAPVLGLTSSPPKFSSRRARCSTPGPEPCRRSSDQLIANRTQSRTLATLRDTLLPKLLSGELSVADLQN